MDNGASSYRRFLEGDESAFDEIMNSLFGELLFFINRYVKDFHSAEDIAIDTFADLIVHKNRYNFKVSLKTYLFMIGRSRALDHIKHRRLIKFEELEKAGDIADGERTLEEKFLIDERSRALHYAISKLPLDMQSAVHLVYFENMTYDETAKIMKKKRKQIDNLLYRAKKELRIILEEGGDGI